MSYLGCAKMRGQALGNAAAILPDAAAADEIGGGLVAENGLRGSWNSRHRRYVLMLVGPSCREANVAQQCVTPMWHSGPCGSGFAMRKHWRSSAISTSWQVCACIGIGGAEEDRTPDLCSAIAALSQLSYGP